MISSMLYFLFLVKLSLLVMQLNNKKQTKNQSASLKTLNQLEKNKIRKSNIKMSKSSQQKDNSHDNTFNFGNELDMSNSKKQKTGDMFFKRTFDFEDFMNIDDKTEKSNSFKIKKSNNSTALKKDEDFSSKITGNSTHNDFQSIVSTKIQTKKQLDQIINKTMPNFEKNAQLKEIKFSPYQTQIKGDLLNSREEFKQSNMINMRASQLSYSKSNFDSQTIMKNVNIMSLHAVKDTMRSPQFQDCESFRKKQILNFKEQNLISSEQQFREIQSLINFYKNQSEKISYQRKILQQESIPQMISLINSQAFQEQIQFNLDEINKLNKDIQKQRAIEKKLSQVISQLESEYNLIVESVQEMNFQRPAVIKDEAKVLMDEINQLKKTFRDLKIYNGSLDLSLTIPANKNLNQIRIDQSQRQNNQNKSEQQQNLNHFASLFQQIHLQNSKSEDPQFLKNLKFACLKDSWKLFQNKDLIVSVDYKTCPLIKLRIGNKINQALIKFTMSIEIKNISVKYMQNQIIKKKAFLLEGIKVDPDNLNEVFLKINISYQLEENTSESKSINLYCPIGLINFGEFVPLTLKEFELQRTQPLSVFKSTFKPIGKSFISSLDEISFYIPNIKKNQAEPNKLYGLFMSAFNEVKLRFSENNFNEWKSIFIEIIRVFIYSMKKLIVMLLDSLATNEHEYLDICEFYSHFLLIKIKRQINDYYRYQIEFQLTHFNKSKFQSAQQFNIRKINRKNMNNPVSIVLKTIGKSESKQPIKLKNHAIQFNAYCQKSSFEDEEIPNLLDTQQQSLLIVKKSQNLLQNLIEDPRKTAFTYKKFLLMQKSLFILTFISLFVSLILTDIQENYGPSQLKLICNCNSLSAFSLIFCIFLRYLAIFELKIHQMKIYVPNFCQNDSIVPIFFMKSTDDIYWLILEIFIIFPHANYFFIGKTITLFQSYDEIYITHEINDLLGIIELVRIYIVLRSLVSISIYSSPRSSRLCKQNGVDHNLLYSIKCILNEEPLRAIFVAFVITLIYLGVGLKLSEGVLPKNNPDLPKTGFESYNNCFWCVFITMGTIGYGDYYPKTFFGRAIIFTTALTGIVLSSILIVSLSAYLEMQPSQSKSHITLMRLKEQQKLKLQATQALCSTIELFRKMQKKQQNNGQKLKFLFSDLKRKIDLVKIRSKKIKCLVDTDNILEQMNRLFQFLKDNLKDIYHNQVIMKAVIQKIRIPKNGVKNSVKLNFAKQMKKAIEDI